MKFNAYLENCRQAICDCIDQTEELGKSIMRRDLIFALHELDAFRQGRLQTCEHCADEESESQTENQSQPEPAYTPPAADGGPSLSEAQSDLRSQVICADALTVENAIGFVAILIRMQKEKGARIVGVTRELIVDGKWHANPTGKLFQLIFENTKTPEAFRVRLLQAINTCSMENGSNTPDFILAEYLGECLAAFNVATKERERWYGRGPKICPAPITPSNPNYVRPKE